MRSKDGAMLRSAGKSWQRAMTMAVIASCSIAAGCDRMMTPPGTQTIRDADAKAGQGDYARAINIYESALDDTPQTAEIHYKLALIYDDKLNEPLNAIHHFRRYLAINPSGARANEVKGFIKRDELALLTNLSGDSMVTRDEAARLRNENLALRKQLEERAAKPRPGNEKASATAGKTANSPHPHSYVVQQGDTLFSIARQFYDSSARWKEIRDANRDKIDKSNRLKPGETLRLP
jgi:nucleoid-associated protein YgaU